MLYQRHLMPMVLEAATDTPVILLTGARQTGKTTLLSQIRPGGASLATISLDDLSVLDAMKTRPQSYLTGLPEQVSIDEVQRAPEIFLPLKESVDQNRKPGRYFLTGSANVLMLPKLADTLAGRMEVLTLWPLSQGEIRGQREKFVASLFADCQLPRHSFLPEAELLRILTTGGYPEAVRRESARRQDAWFQAYITTLLQRDVQDLSRIEGLAALPNLLALLATRAGGLFNAADLSRSTGLPAMTLHRYLKLLEAVYLIVSIPPWFTNLGKRLVKSPRLYLNDTGLLCHLLRAGAAGLSANRNLLGPVLENFVVMEVLKQIGWNDFPVSLYHYRTHTGHEVDIVLQAGQRVVGVEVKSASTLTQDHFKGLRSLQNDAAEAFHRGIVLYTGSQVIQYDNRLWAAPISALWEMGG